MKNKGLFSSLDQNWTTPKDFYNGLNKEFSFDFDPCPNNPNFNGLEIEWGKSNYINPPYKTKLQDAFVKKAVEESNKGKICVMLLPARTGTKRFHELILPNAQEIRFLKDRLCFGDNKKRAPFDSMVIVFNGVGKANNEN